MSSANCTGIETWIKPAHIQLSVQVLLSDGWLQSSPVVPPGTHGVIVTGMHGYGISTLREAAVAAATELMITRVPG